MRNSELKNKILNSNAGQKMYEMVSPMYQESYSALNIFEKIGAEFDDVANIIEKLWTILRPQTCPERELKYWQDEYGLYNESSKDVTVLRKKVITAMKYRASANPAKIENISKAVTGVEARVEEFVTKNKFRLWLLTRETDEKKLRTAIDRVIPAHLNYEIKYEQVIENTCYIAGVIRMNKNFTLGQVN